MKKTLKVTALAVGVFFLAGCGNKQNDNSNGATAKNAKETAQPALSADRGGVISSIKDAMGLGRTMRCVYKIEGGNGGMEMVSYVNGKSYMTETTVAGNVQKSIFNEDGMHSWSPSSKQGTKMTKTCMEELEKAAPKDEKDNSAGPEVPNLDAEEAFEAAKDVKCEEAEADFSIPKDINFVDQCEMMKRMIDSANEMKNRLPGGGPGAGMPEIPDMPDMGSLQQ